MNVLFVRIGAIGDIAMASAAVHSFKQESPQARITWVCGQRVSSLVRLFPFVDEIIEVDDRKLLLGSRADKAGELIRLWRILGRREVDLVACGQADRRYQLLTLWAKSKLFRRFAHASGRCGPLPGRHHIDEYRRLLEGTEGASQPLSHIPLLDVSLDDSLRRQLPAGKPLVLLVPGGAKNLLAEQGLKRWPVQHYATVARHLVDSGHTVVLVGDNNDVWASEAFCDIETVDLIGKTSMKDVIALGRLAHMAVVHDTGVAHLLRFSGIAQLSLFGPTSPFSFGPFARHTDNAAGQLSRYLWGGETLPCRPCYDGINFAACDHNRCMEMISPDAVLEALATLKQSLQALPLSESRAVFEG